MKKMLHNLSYMGVRLEHQWNAHPVYIAVNIQRKCKNNFVHKSTLMKRLFNICYAINVHVQEKKFFSGVIHHKTDFILMSRKYVSLKLGNRYHLRICATYHHTSDSPRFFFTGQWKTFVVYGIARAIFLNNRPFSTTLHIFYLKTIFVLSLY